MGMISNSCAIRSASCSVWKTRIRLMDFGMFIICITNVFHSQLRNSMLELRSYHCGCFTANGNRSFLQGKCFTYVVCNKLTSFVTTFRRNRSKSEGSGFEKTTCNTKMCICYGWKKVRHAYLLSMFKIFHLVVHDAEIFDIIVLVFTSWNSGSILYPTSFGWP